MSVNRKTLAERVNDMKLQEYYVEEQEDILETENAGKCDCGKPGVWYYMPAVENNDFNHFACDECVPRGCSCNEEPIDGNYDNMNPSNWVEPVDEKGRKYPCCEWDKIGDGGAVDILYDFKSN